MEYTLITDSTHARQALAELAPVYEAVFAEPPYNEGPQDVTDFLARYAWEHTIPGFRLVLAREDTTLAGFAYGRPLPATAVWWHGVLDTSLPPAFTREDGHRTFAVMELAVLTRHRGNHTGRHLHDLLLNGVTAERAALCVRPESRAATWYERLGYTPVALTQPTPDAPVYRSMIKTLRQIPGATSRKAAPSGTNQCEV
ncbi:GNAT family N-acetyltransferase [Streptomyces sp. NPDC101118]|uniref:GNAT family N-acetyltransferase n=1 Tax=Streptomyces sp. NPDC101118 TaxID=3366109 RepID=UPI003813848C